MSNRKITGVLSALIISLAAISPVFAQYYVNPYGNPYYNGYAYRAYAPYGAYGYCRPSHTIRNVAVGAGVGAAVGAVVGLLASHHGHRY